MSLAASRGTMRDLSFGTTFDGPSLSQRSDNSRRRANFSASYERRLSSQRRSCTVCPHFVRFRTCVVPGCWCYMYSCCAPAALRFPSYRRCQPAKSKPSNASNRSPSFAATSGSSAASTTSPSSFGSPTATTAGPEPGRRSDSSPAPHQVYRANSVRFRTRRCP
jgi:hypothetical protein